LQSIIVSFLYNLLIFRQAAQLLQVVFDILFRLSGTITGNSNEQTSTGLNFQCMQYERK
jgi:hypothetical protein